QNPNVSPGLGPNQLCSSGFAGSRHNGGGGAPVTPHVQAWVYCAPLVGLSYVVAKSAWPMAESRVHGSSYCDALIMTQAVPLHMSGPRWFQPWPCTLLK